MSATPNDRRDTLPTAASPVKLVARRPLQMVAIILLTLICLASTVIVLLSTRFQLRMQEPLPSSSRPRLFKYLDVGDMNASLPSFVVISRNPRVLYFPALLSAAEAAALVQIGEKSLIPSGVWEAPKGSRKSSKRKRQGHAMSLQQIDTRVADAPSQVKQKKRDLARTSSGTRLPSNDPTVRAVDRRILDIFQRQFKGNHAERIQLLRYRVGEKYNGHLDSFGGITGPFYRSLLRTRRHGGTKGSSSQYVTLDRAVTLLMYLESPVAGGNTSLPFVAATGRPHGELSTFRVGKDDPCDASRYFQVQPIVGSAVAFYSLTEEGVENRKAMHMGCPVLEGVKFVATKWLLIPLPFPSV